MGTVTVDLPEKVYDLAQKETPEALNQKLIDGYLIMAYLSGGLSLGELAETVRLSVVETMGWLQAHNVASLQELPVEQQAATDKARENLLRELGIPKR